MKDTHYDLIVVGSSFASTFFLQKYLGKAPASARVVVLERGHLYPHPERVKELRGEQTPYAALNPHHNDTFINKSAGDKAWRFATGFGGSSNCWVGCTPRFLPNDFRMKQLYGIAQDWPVGYDELDPYYDEAETIMSISGPDDTPFPRKGAYPQPPHLFTSVDKLLHQKYGNLYINQPTARARTPVGSRNMCCVSSTCSLCPVNAKFTIENSGMGVYEDPRVELRYGAQVHHLTLAQNRAQQVHFVQEGKEHQATADAFALGANAIFNAHILLNSGDANPHTGKGIGEQIGTQVTVYLDKLACVGGSTYVPANGYMLYDGDHRKDHAACLIESSNAPFVRMERGKWRDMAIFRTVFEELPHAHNYVAPSADRMKPEVHFKGPSAYVRKGIANMKEKLPGLFSCLPVEKMEFSDPLPTESHILGTTRMSSDPAAGVVDKHLIHHQYRNLFVLGSGSFTTYTPANPTLTLSALSLYAADQAF
jgi:choline dehydrogenase-like flavoprotein